MQVFFWSDLLWLGYTRRMPKNIIQVTHLTKLYKDVAAVDDISFSVKAGEIFAFLGPNGAGKSTTIKMLTTLLRPTSGDILINGFDIQKNQAEIRKQFGIVFQDPSLDDELTAKENLEFHAGIYGLSRKVYVPRILDLLKFVDLYDKSNHMVKTFSGGMKRRLEIARGLLHHPKIFFLDEPTQGLDPQTRNKLWEYIQDLNAKEGITIFFTTHYMEEAEKIASHIAIIDHGRIIADGTLESLLHKTRENTLESAFLKLTGKSLREDSASSADILRNHRRIWRRF